MNLPRQQQSVEECTSHNPDTSFLDNDCSTRGVPRPSLSFEMPPTSASLKMKRAARRSRSHSPPPSPFSNRTNGETTRETALMSEASASHDSSLPANGPNIETLSYVASSSRVSPVSVVMGGDGEETQEDKYSKEDKQDKEDVLIDLELQRRHYPSTAGGKNQRRRKGKSRHDDGHTTTLLISTSMSTSSDESGDHENRSSVVKRFQTHAKLGLAYYSEQILSLPILRSAGQCHVERKLKSGESRLQKLKGWFEKSRQVLLLLLAIVVWYLAGVSSIVTTKIALSDAWEVPPLLLTLQQFTLSSTILQLLLLARDRYGPKERKESAEKKALWELLFQHAGDRAKSWSLSFFCWAAIFNAGDFVASNTAFDISTASFVETIKASEPITTMAVALLMGMDQIRGRPEQLALSLLIAGVLMSMYANAASQQRQQDQSEASLQEESLTTAAPLGLEFVLASARAVATVMLANFCFAFRAMNQKRYRRDAGDNQLDDLDFLCRVQQTGALVVAIPALLWYLLGNQGVLAVLPFNDDSKIIAARQLLQPGSQEYQNTTIATAEASLRGEDHGNYWILAFVNAASFASYNLASCFVLSHVSVLQHSSLGCLRRIFATAVTAIIFHSHLSTTSATGMILSFTGFFLFTAGRAAGKPATKDTVNSSQRAAAAVEQRQRP